MKNYFIKSHSTIEKALELFTRTGLNTLIVIDNRDNYLGTLSNGDVRKGILNYMNLSATIEKLYNKNSIFFTSNNFVEDEARKIFIKYKFDIIPIINKKNKVVKVIKLLEFLKDQYGNRSNYKKINNNLKNVNIVIMAGGLGTRMIPFTEVLPKPLIPIQGKPVINHIIENFMDYGLKKLWLTINYKGQLLKSYLNETKYAKNISYYEEKKQLGTVGALRSIQKKLSKVFILTNCDTIIDTDYAEILSFHKKNKYDLTIVVALKDFNIPYGVCKLDEKDNFLNLEEKPNIQMLVNSGMYILNNEVVNLIPPNKFDMNNLLTKLKKANKRIGVFPVSADSWIDVGNWTEYQKVIDNHKI